MDLPRNSPQVTHIYESDACRVGSSMRHSSGDTTSQDTYVYTARFCPETTRALLFLLNDDDVWVFSPASSLGSLYSSVEEIVMNVMTSPNILYLK